MRFEPRTFTLRDGRTCVLRPTLPGDAREMLRYLTVTSAESDYLLRYPDEVNFTLEGEIDILGRLYDDPHAVMMLAEVDGVIAGNCSVSGLGVKRKVRHRCSFAIALYRAFWGAGIGSAMTRYACELARRMGYGQIELEVVADNARGQRLYEKCGFIPSGRIPDGFRYDDGRFADLVIMTKKLTDGPAP